MANSFMIAAMGLVVASATAQAEIQYELSTGVHSHYVWRGADQGGGQLFDAAFSASTTVKGVDLSASAWYGKTEGSAGLEELDVTLAAEKEFNFATVSAGVIDYSFAGGAGDTQEYFIGLSRDLSYGVSGSFTYYKDIDSNTSNDGYVELGLSKDLEFFGGTFAPTLDVVVGYSLETEKFTHYQATLSQSFKVQAVTVKPYVSYAKADSNANDELFGGASLSVSF